MFPALLNTQLLERASECGVDQDQTGQEQNGIVEMASIANAKEKEAEADKNMKKANKFWSASILDFRLKPDWEAAAPLYEKAALGYKVCRHLSVGLGGPAFGVVVH